jgi:hypothetical protein
VTNIEGRSHSRTHTSGCKGTPGSILKYEAFVYLHVELPSGEFAALRMRLSDGCILRCYQRGQEALLRPASPCSVSYGRLMEPGLI